MTGPALLTFLYVYSFLTLSGCLSLGDAQDLDETSARSYLESVYEEDTRLCRMSRKASWKFASNITKSNQVAQNEADLIRSNLIKSVWQNVSMIPWRSFKDPELRRAFMIYSTIGAAALPENKSKKFINITSMMSGNYVTAKICRYQASPEENCSLSLEPDIENILTTSRNYNELLHAWTEWRNVAGKPIRRWFTEYVSLYNEAARIQGLKDASEIWKKKYESETFEQDLEDLWKEVLPLYEQLHAHVRTQLIKQYGSEHIKPDGPIPAHLPGNMWSQAWDNILDLVTPFPNKPSTDVSETMVKKNMTALDMFKTAESFFVSLGLLPMTPEFWNRSIFTKPKGVELICHASAWDFCDGHDFRIKMCAKVNMYDLFTIHHEMGHVQYYEQYAQQPQVFRTGANPGFHEAVGDLIALSVGTPKHLAKIKLLENTTDDIETDINFLLGMGLFKVAFLPFGYLIDMWRWKVFDGRTPPERYNDEWWKLRLNYQGICPPVRRTEEDFDPAAKYHVTANVPYIRYFVSFIIQFQFHKALCEVANHKGPLHKCDIFKSKEAGERLRNMLRLGLSKHWSEAMRQITGGKESKMSASAILEYFDPLLKWLKQKNKEDGAHVGWKSKDHNVCP